jgi:hypothetical protein
VLTLLGEVPDDNGKNYAANRPVEVSSRYIGGGALGQTSDAQSITDGSLRTIWMTKDEPFPQSCTIDLGKDHPVGCVIVSPAPAVRHDRVFGRGSRGRRRVRRSGPRTGRRQPRRS